MPVHKPEPNPQPRGRPFEKGNGGRKPGSKNRTTLVAEALLKGEEVELVRKAIELAKAGDTQMLKFLLDRLLPKERSVRVDLPVIDGSSDVLDALAAVIAAVSAGRIAPSEAAALASLLADYARTINVAELEERLENIEKDLRVLNPDGSTITTQNWEMRGAPLCRAEGTGRETKAIVTSMAHRCSASRNRGGCNPFVRSSTRQ